MKPHILYVEDDESLSFVTRDNLEQQGYRITWHSDGRKALECAKQQQFDLCILDVMLPEVDGFTIAKTIRASNHDVPIIFLTAKSLKEDRLHKQIGQLQVEVDFLKDSCDKLGITIPEDGIR